MDPSPFSIDDIGLLLAEATYVMGTLEARCIDDEPDFADLPKGMITCGQACRLSAGMVALALQVYPTLAEEGVMENILRNALLNQAAGKPQ